MPRLKVTILIQGRPAKRLYVEHIWRVPLIGIGGPLDLYITDNNGHVIDEKGRLGINTTNDTEVDIRILGQNSIARILRGGAALTVWPIWTDKRVENGTTINIDTGDEHVAHFRILEMAMDSYENVHRHFEPISLAEFPFGRQTTLEATKDQQKRIEIVYPDNLPQPTPFVEPKSVTTTFPLIHLKDKSQATDPQMFDRLFGINGRRPDIIPAELAHALHFSTLDAPVRGQIEKKYVEFLLSDLLRGDDASHRIDKRTTPMVAYLEALDHFSTRASAFVSYEDATSTGFDDALSRRFIEAETEEQTTDEPYWYSKHTCVARTGNGKVMPRKPTFTGLNSEGAVYGAIFLDFANRFGMKEAVKSYYGSKALTFTEFYEWVCKEWPGRRKAMDEIRKNWDLWERRAGIMFRRMLAVYECD
ncbi:hypothetical protein PMZ80_007082 [Knufia obscura]|uniref:Uncharacterized protein n=1 Tax=Knufia obscura TaxID=1635080 RepID=A0ABR0RJA5_9EURO|nr:hypothetical protein PMZ80_007082 [Knufia obscura]